VHDLRNYESIRGYCGLEKSYPLVKCQILRVLQILYETQLHHLSTSYSKKIFTKNAYSHYYAFRVLDLSPATHGSDVKGGEPQNSYLKSLNGISIG
jgi:hypothetical protein